MGSFVSEMVFAVRDDAYEELAQLGGIEAFGDLVTMVQDGPAPREFASTSFDHYVFLGPLIETYGADDLRPLLRFDEHFDMTTRYHANPTLHGIARGARALSVQIGARPDGLIGLVQRSLTEMIIAQESEVAPAGEPAWLRDKRAENHADLKEALARFSLSPADVTALLAAAVPSGFVSGDFPDAVTALGERVAPHTDLVECAFQSLCYLLFLALHHDEIASQGYGVVHLLPA